MTAEEWMRAVAAAINALPAIEWSNEYDLQAALATGIEAALPGAVVEREVRLDRTTDRIDITVEAGRREYAAGHVDAETRIGVEVKVQGALSSVVRQLERYAQDPDIDGLVLVTTRSKHHRIPTEMNGKPVRLVSLVGRSL